MKTDDWYVIFIQYIRHYYYFARLCFSWLEWDDIDKKYIYELVVQEYKLNVF